MKARSVAALARNIKLLPCPFCGSPATVQCAEESGYVVQCDGPRCQSSSAVVYALDEDVADQLAERWNTRAGGTAIDLGLLQGLLNKLATQRSKATTSLDRAQRRQKHADLLAACGYQGDPDADRIECEALRDAYDDAVTMVQALMDAVREHNEAVP